MSWLNLVLKGWVRVTWWGWRWRWTLSGGLRVSLRVGEGEGEGEAEDAPDNRDDALSSRSPSPSPSPLTLKPPSRSRSPSPSHPQVTLTHPHPHPSLVFWPFSICAVSSIGWWRIGVHHRSTVQIFVLARHKISGYLADLSLFQKKNKLTWKWQRDNLNNTQLFVVESVKSTFLVCWSILVISNRDSLISIMTKRQISLSLFLSIKQTNRFIFLI